MGSESTDGEAAGASSIPVATEEHAGRRFPRVRRVFVAGLAGAGIAGGVLAWRRFRGRGASDEEPVIEERPVSSTQK